MSRLRHIRRNARGDVHRHGGVPAFYFSSSTAAALPCTVRVWRKREALPNGDLPNFPGAERAEPEDRLRLALSDFPPSNRPRRLGVVVIDPEYAEVEGEAYRLDRLDPVDGGYQTVAVIALGAADTRNYEIPA